MVKRTFVVYPPVATYLWTEKTETQLNGLTRTNTDNMDADKEEVNFLLI